MGQEKGSLDGAGERESVRGRERAGARERERAGGE